MSRAMLLACLLAGSLISVALTGVAQGEPAEPMWTTYHRDPGHAGYEYGDRDLGS